jgi:hypothetical protein
MLNAEKSLNNGLKFKIEKYKIEIDESLRVNAKLTDGIKGSEFLRLKNNLFG